RTVRSVLRGAGSGGDGSRRRVGTPVSGGRGRLLPAHASRAVRHGTGAPGARLAAQRRDPAPEGAGGVLRAVRRSREHAAGVGPRGARPLDAGPLRPVARHRGGHPGGASAFGRAAMGGRTSDGERTTPVESHDLTGAPAHRGTRPQLADHFWPGWRESRSFPVRSALGGQVIGSIATARRRRATSPSVSPV